MKTRVKTNHKPNGIMGFAKREMLKYGWSEGKGLGKHENGISEALKPKLKFDTTGIGHNSSEQFTFNWWENVYNNAADNINVNKSDEGINIELSTSESVNITTKKYTITEKAKKNGLEYGSFLKTSKLTAEGVVDHEDKLEASIIEDSKIKVINLTDEELFKACGGRTAHKGARHGVKMNGKNCRLAQQEAELEEKLLQTQDKTLRKEKQKQNNSKTIVTPNLTIVTDEVIVKKTKKKTDKTISANDKIQKEILNDLKSSLGNTKNKNNKNMNVDKKEIQNNTQKADINIDNLEQTDTFEKKKKKRKRKHDIPQNVNEMDELEAEAIHKRYENFCDNRERKKFIVKKRKEEKKIDKIIKMIDNFDLNKEAPSEDDGYDEVITKKIKLLKNDGNEEIKKKCKHGKKNCKKGKCNKLKNDDQFNDLMTETKDKLNHAVVLRKKMEKEKRKSDDLRIEKIANEFRKFNV